MNYLWALVFCVIGTIWRAHADLEKFPPWFKFGAATAAYQVEGAWNVSDKSESIWDRLLHSQPEVVEDGTNGDVACDSYHLWRRDIEMAEELGLDMYRFSISWPRLLPTGFADVISEAGKNYYNNLIDGLLEKGIEPMVTIYHFDLPQSLQDLGGWENPLMTEWFTDYARVVFTLFGDRVKLWITINEPLIVCDGGYTNIAAPYLDFSKSGIYTCSKHILLAHAKAYRLYDLEFRDKFHGKISLSNLFIWYVPETPEDEEVTTLALQLLEGRFAHAIFSKEGGWPAEMERVLTANSQSEGYKESWLPAFSEEEIELVKGTYDYYALNHYVTRMVRQVPRHEAGPWFYAGSEELGVSFVTPPSWEVIKGSGFTPRPESLRDILHWINDTYGVDEIIITENGVPDMETDTFDWRRVSYLRRFLEQALLAINDGVNVTGYTVWSMMDTFEWTGGHVSSLGLYAVDFTDENRTRTPRESAKYYSKVTRSKSLYHT